jgi:hypothetical protein
MAAIIYLDVDDEITSAAARMRSAEERRVVLVVPGGSRLATSRINFRLLAREAQARGRRLWIVAGDGATRALAASAGLAVYGSVVEYEEAMEVPAPPVPESGGEEGLDAAPPGRRRRTSPTHGASEIAEASAASGVVGAAGAAGVAAAAGAGATDAAMADSSIAADAEIAAIGAAAAPSGATPPGLTSPAPVAEPVPRQRPAYTPEPRPERRPARAPDRAEAGSWIPIARPRREWPVGRTTAIIAAIALAMIVAVGGVAAYVFLPSATIVVTARPVTVGPVDLTVRADPAATGANPETDTVPAQELKFKVEVTDTFQTKGKRIEETRATGNVTFSNYNSDASNTVLVGSIVATPGGLKFRVDESVTVPAASRPPEIIPGQASAKVTAVEKGTSGNVSAHTISVPPPGEPISLLVDNPEPTQGGSHKEFPRVGQDEIDAALASLRKQLSTKFNQLLGNPSGVPEGMTLFPETKALGRGTPSSDPKDLLDKEVDSFELGMTANGTVTAVDEAAVEDFAKSEIAGDVAEGHRLVDDSVSVSIGDPTVDGDVVTFPVTATAQQVRELDAKGMLAQVKGKTVPQARSILEQFGQVELSVWPEWVTAIPTIDARVSLIAETSSTPVEPGGSTQPGGSAEPDASASP